jgi:hypothetical protein
MNAAPDVWIWLVLFGVNVFIPIIVAWKKMT